MLDRQDLDPETVEYWKEMKTSTYTYRLDCQRCPWGKSHILQNQHWDICQGQLHFWIFFGYPNIFLPINTFLGIRKIAITYPKICKSEGNFRYTKNGNVLHQTHTGRINFCLKINFSKLWLFSKPQFSQVWNHSIFSCLSFVFITWIFLRFGAKPNFT